jgi:hypothetical protein
MFCNFTNKYILYFFENKYNIKDNNYLLLSLINEKNTIINYINNNKILITYKIINNYDVSKYMNSKFVSNKLKNELHKLNINIKITWFNNYIIIKTDLNNLKLLIYKIKIIIYIYEYLKTKSLKKISLKIYLILSNLKKTNPILNNYLDIDNVNSGYTHSKKNYIFIWRLEEFEKVLFHEIIHFLQFDNKNIKYDIIINTNKDNHNYFETFTDFYGRCTDFSKRFKI